MRAALVLVAVLLAGCSMASKPFSTALGHADSERLSGPEIISITEQNGRTTVTCTGGCTVQKAHGQGFTEGFIGFLTAAVKTAVGLVLPGR